MVPGGGHCVMFVSSTAPAAAFTLGLFEERGESAYLILNDITDIRYEKGCFVPYEAGTVKKIVLEYGGRQA